MSLQVPGKGEGGEGGEGGGGSGGDPSEGATAGPAEGVERARITMTDIAGGKGRPRTMMTEVWLLLHS